MMKVHKGLPAGYINVNEALHPLIERLSQLSVQDVKEVVAFVDYLEGGADSLGANGAQEPKFYDFMENGVCPDVLEPNHSDERI